MLKPKLTATLALLPQIRPEMRHLINLYQHGTGSGKHRLRYMRWIRAELRGFVGKWRHGRLA